jgi:hypothetical protein
MTTCSRFNNRDWFKIFENNVTEIDYYVILLLLLLCYLCCFKSSSYIASNEVG